MCQLEYYLDLKNNFVCCYDSDVEFFAVYSKEENAWVSSRISFSQFSHDYVYKEITFGDAMSLCNDNIPDEKYFEYLETLFKNGGIIKTRKIKIIRESDSDYLNKKVYLYVDGKKYQSIEDNKNVNLVLDFKDHMITVKTDESNIKTYDLHIPYGIDDYVLTLTLKNNEAIIV